jgi:hypothetical protein
VPAAAEVVETFAVIFRIRIDFTKGMEGLLLSLRLLHIVVAAVKVVTGIIGSDRRSVARTASDADEAAAPDIGTGVVQENKFMLLLLVSRVAEATVVAEVIISDRHQNPGATTAATASRDDRNIITTKIIVIASVLLIDRASQELRLPLRRLWFCMVWCFDIVSRVEACE